MKIICQLGQLIRIVVITFAISFCASACGKQKEVPQELFDSLKSDVLPIVRDSEIHFYPKSDYLNDTIFTEELQNSIVEKPAPPKIANTIMIWLSTNDSFASVTQYYKKIYPHVISEEKTGDKTTFVQVANVEKIETAVARDISPIIVVEIRDVKLTEKEKSVYKNELEGLRRRSKNDLSAQRRMSQVEKLMREKPLVRINARTISKKA